jgi:hypothetical protein
VRIAVISPFVDRQHGTERALAELLDRLSAQHRDTIDLYAQKVSDLSYEPESSVEKTDHGRIIWHRVKALPGPHLRMAVRSRGFEFASPPPIRAAMVISRMIRVKTRPRFASVAAFLCLMVAHFECPDMTIPLLLFVAHAAI